MYPLKGILPMAVVLVFLLLVVSAEQEDKTLKEWDDWLFEARKRRVC
jgi:hypothetical protein